MSNVKIIAVNDGDEATLTAAYLNKLTQPEDFTHADWTSTATVTGNSTTDPNGTSLADTLDDQSGAAAQSVHQTITVADNSAYHKVSVYLKEGTATQTVLKISMTGGTGVTGSVEITWADHTVATTGTASGAVATLISSGWYRLSFHIANNGTGNTSLKYEIFPAGETVSETGTVYAWGAMVNNGTTLVEYSNSGAGGNPIDTTMVVGNLQNPSRARVMRTVGTVGVEILGNFSVNKLVGGLALARHNLSSTSQFRIELFDGANQTGNTLYDSGYVQTLTRLGWGAFTWGLDEWGAVLEPGDIPAISVDWFTGTIIRSFRISLVDSQNADGYLEVGRLFLGYAISPKYNLPLGHSLSWEETTIQVRTDGGTLRSEPSEPYRRIEFRLSTMPETDRQLFTKNLRNVGLRKDMLVSLFPEEGGLKEIDYTVVAKLVQVPKFTEDYNNYYSSQYILEEV